MKDAKTTIRNEVREIPVKVLEECQKAIPIMLRTQSIPEVFEEINDWLSLFPLKYSNLKNNNA